MSLSVERVKELLVVAALFADEAKDNGCSDDCYSAGVELALKELLEIKQRKAFAYIEHSEMEWLLSSEDNIASVYRSAMGDCVPLIRKPE